MRPIRKLVASVAILPIAIAAGRSQQPERATFYVIRAADTVAIEHMERSAATLSSTLRIPAMGARSEIKAQLGANGLVSSATMKMFLAERDTVPTTDVAVRFLGDSIGVTQSQVTNWVRVGAGALPNTNPSGAFIEQMLIRARALGVDSVEIPLMYLPQGPAVRVTIVRRGSDSAVVRFPAVAILASVSDQGRLLGATIPTQGVRIVRGPGTSVDPGTAKDYGPPAGAPYSAQEVTIRTPAGITLRGTLTLPQRPAGGKSPAVVTITGSGPQDRDAAIKGLKGYRPYYQLADTLGRRGVAVLRLDDRGAGSDPGPSTVTTADFADDIRAAVAYLRGRPEIDGKRIGLVGHSEGGTIAPMVASTDSAIAAVVIMGGTVSKGREVITFQQRYVVDSMAHLLGQQRDAALAQYARNTDSVAASMPWMKFFLDYDGRPAASRVRAPVLILHGEKDYQVPVAEAEKTAAAIRAGGNRDVTVRVFSGTNHLFLPDGGVGFSYEKLPSFVLKPEVMGAMADWLAARLRP